MIDQWNPLPIQLQIGVPSKSQLKKQTEPNSKTAGWLPLPKIMVKSAAPAIPKAKMGQGTAIGTCPKDN